MAVSGSERALLHSTQHPESSFMTFEYAAGAVLAVLLTVYLVYALLRPERF